MILSPAGVRALIVGIVLAGASAAISGAIAAQKGPANPPKGVPPDPADEAETITDAVKAYRRMRLVNPEPKWVPDPLAALCRPALPSVDKVQMANPHRGKWMRVYVNSVGKSAMLTHKVPKFPAGTIIVKEKLPEKKSGKPELLTVMAKRAKGYDPANGDWEYLALSGDGTKVQERGKLANCMVCHVPRKDNGYVFRDYLPEDVEKRLK